MPPMDGRYLDIDVQLPYLQLEDEYGGYEAEIALNDKYSLTRQQYFEIKYSDMNTSVTSFTQIEIYGLLALMGNIIAAAAILFSICCKTFYTDLNF